MAILGIDPGKSGGYALIHDDGDIVLYVGNDIDLLTSILLTHSSISHVFIEKAQAMPKQGVVSMFSYGQTFGSILGAITALKRPYTLVPPSTWTKQMLQGVPTNLKNKQRAAEAARRLFPCVEFTATERSTKPHEGLVDAILIAEYGRRLLK